MSGQTATPIRVRYRHVSVAGMALLAVLAVLICVQPGWMQRLQLVCFDTYQMLAPRQIASTPLTVVEIDDASIAEWGQWPWPRTLLAELIRAIEREQPLAIGLDILMPEPDRLSPERLLARARERDPVLAQRLDALASNDRELAQAIAAGPVVLALAGTPYPGPHEPLAPPVVVIQANRGGQKPVAVRTPVHAGALTSIDELDRAASGHGLISAGSSDDVIRRVPLVARIRDRFVPALAIEMLRVALRAPEIRVFVEGASVKALGVGDFVAPTEPDGEFRIYYSRHDPRRFVSAKQVLAGTADPLSFKRKLVLIGTTGLALVDYQNTPLGNRMPGSEIHAQVLENLVDQTWLSRPSWAPLLEGGALVLFGLPLVWATPRCRAGNAALLALGCVSLPVIAGGIAFLFGRLVFDAATPAAGLVLVFGALLVLALTESGRQRKQLVEVVHQQREQAAYIAGELEAARRIQLGFLPRADVLRDDRRVALAASMVPAREVGGDLYDFFLIDGDRLFFMIGDVAGKGLSASLFMAVTKALYKSTTLRQPDASIGDVMRTANDEISRDNTEMFFVTVFAGILDLDSGDLAYCNAGHENPCLLHLSGKVFVRLVDAAGPPLCAVEHFPYETGHRRIEPGQLLCLVTDGVVDATSSSGERYGSGRLEAVLASSLSNETTSRGLVDALLRDVQKFATGAEAADDVTVLAWQWLGPSNRL